MSPAWQGLPLFVCRFSNRRCDAPAAAAAVLALWQPHWRCLVVTAGASTVVPVMPPPRWL